MLETGTILERLYEQIESSAKDRKIACGRHNHAAMWQRIKQHRGISRGVIVQPDTDVTQSDPQIYNSMVFCG